MTRKLFLGSTFVITSLCTFGILYLHGTATTPGPAVLSLGPRSTDHAVLPLPAGWRVRPNGIDKWKQCAVLIDPTSTPRLMVCAFGYPPGSEQHPGSPDDAATLATRLAGNRRTADERVASDVHRTAVGAIHEVARTYRTSASYWVVTSGTVVEREFVRTAGAYLLLVRMYEDAAQRAALDPVALELAERAEIRQPGLFTSGSQPENFREPEERRRPRGRSPNPREARIECICGLRRDVSGQFGEHRAHGVAADGSVCHDLCGAPRAIPSRG